MYKLKFKYMRRNIVNKAKTIKCEICGEIFKSDILGKEKQKLTKHIKNCHVDITMSEYVEKYYYNGERPRCACGCGNFTKYNKYKLKILYKH